MLQRSLYCAEESTNIMVVPWTRQLHLQTHYPCSNASPVQMIHIILRSDKTSSVLLNDIWKHMDSNTSSFEYVSTQWSTTTSRRSLRKYFELIARDFVEVQCAEQTSYCRSVVRHVLQLIPSMRSARQMENFQYVRDIVTCVVFGTSTVCVNTTSFRVHSVLVIFSRVWLKITLWRTVSSLSSIVCPCRVWCLMRTRRERNLCHFHFLIVFTLNLYHLTLMNHYFDPRIAEQSGDVQYIVRSHILWGRVSTLFIHRTRTSELHLCLRQRMRNKVSED